MMKRTLFFLLSLLLLTACGGEERRLQRNEEVRELLTRFVELLPDVYAQQDTQIIAEVATPRERVEIERMLEKLRSRNYRLEAKLMDMQITYIDIFNESNAYVRTTEIWDVTSYNLKTGEIRGSQRGEVLHVTYQMKEFHDEGWLVTARIVEETKKPRVDLQ